MDYKTVICGGYCKYHAENREDKCSTCGDLCRNFEMSDLAKTMVAEELLEPVLPVYTAYLDLAVKEFTKRLTEGAQKNV